MSIEFKVLGPLQVRVDGRVLPLPAGRARILLAALLLHAGEVVSADRLVHWLWDGAPPNPARAKATLQMVVTRLRQALGEANVIRTVADGYLAEVPPGGLDLHRYRDLVERGRTAEALALWSDDPLSDVRSDTLHRDEVEPLLEHRLAVLEQRLAMDLEAGRAAGVVPELRALTRRHPVRERFWELLVRALRQAERQAEALAAYQEARERLTAELGVGPGPALREQHRLILNAEPPSPAPSRPHGSSQSPASHPPGLSAAPMSHPPRQSHLSPPGPSVPRQLPAPPESFVGRDEALRELSAAAAGEAVVISAINGTAGIGKTALAVHWAHQVAERFPDGQLYANLRGFDPSGRPSSPSDVLRGFLEALGVPRGRIPATVDEQAALYRSMLADRSVLVLLDNARDVDQVRPLLPGTPGCLVLVTSRDRLTGLVVREGARPVRLGLLSRQESVALLEARLGRSRPAAEPAAVDVLVDRCAGLPLALAVVAARTAGAPAAPLSAFAGELAADRTRLDALTTVWDVFSWSYEHLGDCAARLFRLLGVHPGPDVSLPAAASLAAMTATRARRALAELVQAHLVTEHLPGRYTIHDLLRAYAADRAGDEPGTGLREAEERLLDHLLHTAEHADRVLYPQREPVELPPAGPGVTPEPMASHAAALDWFHAEFRVLAAAAARAAERGSDAHAWRIPQCMATWLHSSGHWLEWLDLCAAGLAAAERLGDPRGRAEMHRGLGRANTLLHRWDEGERHLNAALRLFEELGERALAAYVHVNLGGVCELRNQHAESLRRYLRGLALFRELGHAAGEARALTAVAYIHHELRQHEEAVRQAMAALALYERLADLPGQAAVTENLGLACRELGRMTEAVAYQRRGLELFARSGERYYEAGAWRGLGETYRRLGDLDAARDALRHSLDLFTDLRHPHADDVRAELTDLGIAR
ncbi:AfsR/SARP family transcriptional regulator [Actinosynnema sp. CS-041913]|uniref:AfsR/SARP family transcriptional regulator n=1 Tax=Actinosynnema sp. CS-041913 TaxID=3239917 RepID=UPI003D9044DA